MTVKKEQPAQANKAHQDAKPSPSKQEQQAPTVLKVPAGEQDESLVKVQVSLAEAQDKYTRLSAEFENFRRRTDDRVATLIEAANEAILIKLLPIVDDFERALATTAQNNTSIEAMQQGIKLIYDKLMHLLQQEHVELIGIDKGIQFDADLHQAITQAPIADEALKGKVVEVVEKGYRLKGRVLRFAKVIIGS